MVIRQCSKISVMLHLQLGGGLIFKSMYSTTSSMKATRYLSMMASMFFILSPLALKSALKALRVIFQRKRAKEAALTGEQVFLKK